MNKRARRRRSAIRKKTDRAIQAERAEADATADMEELEWGRHDWRALRKLVQDTIRSVAVEDGKIILIEKMTVQINCASGGGATVNCRRH